MLQQSEPSGNSSQHLRRNLSRRTRSLTAGLCRVVGVPVFWHRLLRQFRLLSRCNRTSFITSDFPYYNFNIFSNYLLIVCNPVSRLRNGCSTFLLYIFYYDKPIYFFLIIYYSLNFEHFVHILFTNFSQSHHTIDTIQLYTLSIS